MSKVAWGLRRAAILGNAGRLAYTEMTAELIDVVGGEIMTTKPDSADRDAWYRSIPGLGRWITEEGVADLVDELEELFDREILCVWEPEPSDNGPRIIPADDWALCQDPDADWSDRLVYAIAVGPDGKAATIAASDGRVVAVLEWHKGSRWLPAKLAEILADKPGDVFLDEKSPAGALLPDLTDAGIEWRPVNGTEMAQACGGLFSAITETHDLCHAGQGTLDIAVANCTRRNYSGAWVWDARKASVDISPLDAVTIARWAALQTGADYDVLESVF